MKQTLEKTFLKSVKRRYFFNPVYEIDTLLELPNFVGTHHDSKPATINFIPNAREWVLKNKRMFIINMT